MTSLLDELLKVPMDEIESWEPEARAWYETTLQREKNLRSPADFALAHSYGMWKPYRHLVYTSDAIVDMTEHDKYDLLIVEEPVRHGKSELCSKWTPAWYIAKHGRAGRRALLSSYEAEFARAWGRKARDIIAEVLDQYGLEKNKDVWTQENWELTTGAGMGTAGARGAITGKGGHLLICDDPVKSKQEADSPVIREQTWEWWDSTWTTRRMGKETKYLLIMSRWHTDDITGRLIKIIDQLGMRVRRLRMPALAEDDDELGRRPGEALCPELYDEDTLDGIRKTSPIAWPALYQQRPVAAGGGLFKKDNLAEYGMDTIGDSTVLRFGDRLAELSECMVFATMDTAYTNTKTSDYTAIGVWAVPPADDRPLDLALLDMRRLRIESSAHARLIEEVWEDWPDLRWVGIEKINATFSLFAEASRKGIIMRWLKPDGNKVARAETAMALSEQGRLWLPREAVWLDDYVDELTLFPSAEHDDMVDVTSYAAAEVARRHVRGRRHKRQAESAEDLIWEKVQAMNKTRHRHGVLGRWP